MLADRTLQKKPTLLRINYSGLCKVHVAQAAAVVVEVSKIFTEESAPAIALGAVVSRKAMNVAAVRRKDGQLSRSKGTTALWNVNLCLQWLDC